ncbi:MAG: hypothetical protein RBT64_09060 [Trichloromonas sp.]|jgi:hypothetical protein|nr:hypothetical protein [Trichloromonas sp.]
MSRLSCHILLFFICLLLLSGCGSARFTSTLKPSGNSALTINDQQFRLADYTLAFDKESDSNWYKFDSTEVRSRARNLYPRLFTDDWTAVPVTATAVAHYDSPAMLPAFLTALTAGIIPFPTTEGCDFQVTASVVDEHGDMVPIPAVKFRRENGLWASILGPLGALPVPGETLIPRDTMMLLDLSGAGYSKKNKELNNDTLVEAVVEGLRRMPPERLSAMAQARQARMKEVSIEGTPYWAFLTPRFSQEVVGRERADEYVVLLYRERPKPDLQPAEETVVARREGTGRWQPVPAYLRKTAQGLVSISALLENGAPARVVVKEMTDPPLEDFIVLPEKVADDRAMAELVHWSNRVLLQAKNRTLPQLVRTLSTNELLDLVTQAENAFLDLSRLTEMAKDRGQKAVAEGSDGGAARELSLTYRERGDILKPILAALKQEIAARGGR